MKRLQIFPYPIAFFILLLSVSLTYAQDDSDNIYVKLLEKAASSVVSINVEREEEKEPPKNPFEQLLGPNIFGKRPSGPVTGTIIDSDGYIMTSYFNVEGKVKKIEVTYNGKEYKAKLLGYHARKDIALLKIKAKDLPALEKAKIDTLKIGQMVAAIGVGPDGKTPTVNQGIISAFNRNWGWMLQTDARLNYGNVGGPLVDLEDKLIGITCLISTATSNWSGQNSGVSLAVTMDKIDEILPDLKNGKKLGEGKPGFLGVELEDAGDVEGVKIKNVLENTAAEEAGLEKGDIIKEFNGKKVNSVFELRQAIDVFNAGDKAKVKILRDKDEKDVDVTLGERPAPK